MQYIYKSILLIIICNLIVACGGVDEPVSTLKIVNGTLSKKNSMIARHTVALIPTHNSKKAYCSGSVIDTKLAITAAHCVKGKKTVHVAFDLGFKADARVVSIKAKVIIHPEYRKAYKGTTYSNKNDIALLILTTKIPKSAKPVQLFPGESSKLGTKVVIAGYGKTQEQLLLPILKKQRLDLAAKLESQFSQKYFHKKNYYSRKIDEFFEKIFMFSGLISTTKSKNKIRNLKKAINQLAIMQNTFFQQIDIDLLKEVKTLNNKNYDILDLRITRLETLISSKKFGAYKKLRQTTTKLKSIIDKVLIYESENKTNSACYGDSGGPMYVKIKNKYYLLGVSMGGILSKSTQLEKCKETGVYSNINRYKKFLKLYL